LVRVRIVDGGVVGVVVGVSSRGYSGIGLAGDNWICNGKNYLKTIISVR
jgi:hypothetical protein